jgi:Iron permease FTR1 family
VYWNEHLADLHGRKKRVLGVGGLAATLGLVTLGFASVYREGFETVLFVQAIVLEAGTLPVLAGVAVGAAATAVVGVLTITLQQKLPNKKMLIGSGLLIVWVLVVMVGTTVQALQVAGWVPVTPVDELRLPYWSASGSGSIPTGASAARRSAWQALPDLRAGEKQGALPLRPRPASAEHPPLEAGAQAGSRTGRQPLPLRGRRLLRPARGASHRGDQTRRRCIRPRQHRDDVQAPSLPGGARRADARNL